MQQSLPLHSPAFQITAFAVFFHLSNMPGKSFPSFYLPEIFRMQSSSHIITAVFFS
jgi:hypothetical protein